MRLVDLRGQRLSKAGYSQAIPRAALDVAEARMTGKRGGFILLVSSS